MGGFAKVAPKFAILFMILLLGSMGVPLTNGFIGEFVLLKSIFDYDKVVARTQEATNTNKIGCDSGKFSPLNADASSTAIIIGDSGVGVLANMQNNPLKQNGIAVSFNCFGKTVPWLVQELTKDGKDKKYPNVKTIYVKIGTNDGYVANQITGVIVTGKQIGRAHV